MVIGRTLEQSDLFMKPIWLSLPRCVLNESVCTQPSPCQISPWNIVRMLVISIFHTCKCSHQNSVFMMLQNLFTHRLGTFHQRKSIIARWKWFDTARPCIRFNTRSARSPFHPSLPDSRFNCLTWLLLAGMLKRTFHCGNPISNRGWSGYEGSVGSKCLYLLHVLFAFASMYLIFF
jgi:hypothetical protein